MLITDQMAVHQEKLVVMTEPQRTSLSSAALQGILKVPCGVLDLYYGVDFP